MAAYFVLTAPVEVSFDVVPRHPVDRLAFTGASDANGTSVAYEVSTDGGTNWSATVASQSGLGDGSYRFRAVVTDAAGNTTTSSNPTMLSVLQGQQTQPATLAGPTMVATPQALNPQPGRRFDGPKSF